VQLGLVLQAHKVLLALAEQLEFKAQQVGQLVLLVQLAHKETQAQWVVSDGLIRVITLLIFQ
jgi:hypothetical protein